MLLFPLLLRNKPQNLQVAITVSEKQTKTISLGILEIFGTHNVEDYATVTHRLTFGPQTSGWGWYIVGCCTWPRIHIA